MGARSNEAAVWGVAEYRACAGWRQGGATGRRLYAERHGNSATLLNNQRFLRGKNMAIKLDETVKALLENTGAVKVLASIDKNGMPHVTFKDSIRLNSGGNLEYDEIIESSQTNKNLVFSIWFNKQVAINVLGPDKTSFQIKGIPVKALIYGKKFEERYNKLKAEKGLDLSTIWIIEPHIIIEETFAARRAYEDARHPLLRHLDTAL
jgi:hypothetical protein